MNTKAAELKAKMQAMIESRDTPSLFCMLDELDSHRVVTASGISSLPDEHERMVHAMIADTIEARHGLAAAMDAIFEKLDYGGSYADALKLSYAAVVK